MTKKEQEAFVNDFIDFVWEHSFLYGREVKVSFLYHFVDEFIKVHNRKEKHVHKNGDPE